MCHMTLHVLFPMHIGFAAVDLTVASLTEIMWSLVILDHALLGVVLKFSIKFLLAPVSLSFLVWSLCNALLCLGFSSLCLLFSCDHATLESQERKGKDVISLTAWWFLI